MPHLSQAPADLRNLSRAAVNRAGLILADRNSVPSQLAGATVILAEWRRRHALPLNELRDIARAAVNDICPGAVVVHRLKREPSIAAKLRRPGGMELARMQDLGGIRVVVPDMVRLNALKVRFAELCHAHECIRTYDYIAAPKESGYRSLHHVLRYVNTSIPESNGLLIELQVRTEIQHAWATTLETVDVFRNSSLKSSQGPEDWQDYFRLAGAAFAVLEGCAVPEEFRDVRPGDILAAAVETTDGMLIPQKLRSYAKAVNAINGANDGNTCFLLELDIANSEVRYRSFSPGETEVANAEYRKAEAAAVGKDINAVLVAAESPEVLREAYPNYFMQTGRFVELLDQLRAAVRSAAS